MVDKTEVLHHKFPFGHSVLRTCIQQPYHFEVKSQSLMESASFSHTEISFDSFPQTYFEKQHAHTVQWPIKAIGAMEEPVGFPFGVERNKCISFSSRNRISEPSSGPKEGRASSFLPYEGRESKCHFPLRLWIITFMLWDQFASLIRKTISCLDETFPWMLSINWALKLLTRNSGLSCLKTQSGSWKHGRFLDLQKWAKTSFFHEVTNSTLCLIFRKSYPKWSLFVDHYFSLSLSHCLSDSISPLCLTLSLCHLRFLSLLLLPSLTWSHIHFSFLFFHHTLKAAWAQLRSDKTER